MRPLVSICIPTYNAEPFIAETIESALGQTYSAIEVVISDDQSTDRTLEIAEPLLMGSGIPFRILHHRQLGLGHNWNHCIEQAQGKYIKFLFQDDRLYPTCIETMVTFAEQHPTAGLIFCRRNIVYADHTQIDPIYTHITAGWQQLQAIQSGEQLLHDPHLFNPPLNKIGEPSNTLIPKAVFDRIGGFDPELFQVIDLDMWLRICGQYDVGFIDSVLSDFRVHQGQLSQHNHQSGIAWIDSWKLFFKFLTDPTYDFLSDTLKKQVASRCSSQMLHSIHELRQLRSQNLILDQQVQSLGQSNENLGNQVDRMGQEIQAAHAQLIAAQQSFAQLAHAEARLQSLGQELENLHALYLAAVQQVQAASDQLMAMNTNLVETQTQLAQSNSALAAQAASLDHLQQSYDRLSIQLMVVSQERDQRTLELTTTQATLQATEQELSHRSAALDAAQDQITAMESSKFWQLRLKWIALKERFSWK